MPAPMWLKPPPTTAAGTNTGLNTVVWDGTNDNGSAAAAGVYNISITAAAAGYDDLDQHHR
jgi:flagellar hook assembly protein FlgD